MGTGAAQQRFTLELDLEDTDSIAGRLIDQTGRATDFVGWLGLASAIECLATDTKGSEQ